VPTFSIEWGAMAAYAVAGLFGFWLVIEGFKRVDASIGSLIGLLEIIFAVALGVIFFHETLRISVIIGGALILLAAMLPDAIDVLRHHYRKRPDIPAREI
jgi:drug/metabolite transporter (DMT)-like permease